MLRVHVKNLGAVAILCLQGRIVAGETAVLRNAVRSQLGLSGVVLDLARVSTIDAGGLGVMLELREEIRAKGMTFRLINVPALVKRVFEITRLISVFDITSGAEVLAVASRGRAVPLFELPSCA